MILLRADFVNVRNQTIQERLANGRGARGPAAFFLNQKQAIDYACCQACVRFGELRVLDSTGAVTRTISFDERDRTL
jgi:hypothetical protein